ncbi:unnamed protein product [Alopecurus aequalis]
MKLVAFGLLLLGCLQSLADPSLQVIALHEMRMMLTDSHGVLEDWNNNQASPCYFANVRCDQDGDVIGITLSSSGLSGVLSPSIATLTTLQQLLLDGNSITGGIPQELGNLSNLMTLKLGRNSLNGSIPESFGLLSELQNLDLSQNLLIGNIPGSLSNLPSLNNINLAYNSLSGEIPEQLLQVSQYNYTGNHLSCGHHLISCAGGTTKTATGGSRKSTLKAIIASIGGAVTLAVVVVLFLLWWQRMRHRPEIYIDVAGQHDHSLGFGQIKRFSWRELQIATNNFSEQSVLGKGGFGKVYKGVLPGPDSKKVAVKRLFEVESPEGEMAFLREVELISIAAHKNILRLIGFCTTPTERLLVYPFMENLSVASRLRGERAIFPNFLEGAGEVMLIDQVKLLMHEGRLEEIVDRNINCAYDFQELVQIIKVALLCTHINPDQRPAMSEVVQMFEGNIVPEDQWEEWQLAELTRRQQYENKQHHKLFSFSEESLHIHEAIELSGGR